VSCPTPTKMGYSTRREAVTAASTMRRTGKRPVKLRAYHCSCHRWHLSSFGAVEAEISKLMRAIK
jgi:hypothetical protein